MPLTAELDTENGSLDVDSFQNCGSFFSASIAAFMAERSAWGRLMPIWRLRSSAGRYAASIAALCSSSDCMRPASSTRAMLALPALFRFGPSETTSTSYSW